MAAENALAIDIGGTSMKTGVVTRRGGTLSVTHQAVTQHQHNDIESLVATVLTTIGKTLDKVDPPVIGISTTGSVRRDGTVAKGAFFSGYEEFSWSNVIRSEFDSRLSVAVLNDGHAATVGSYVAEHQSRPNPFALLVVGTGIGGGIIVDGTLLVGAHGFAGAFGHIKVRAGDDQPCSCSRPGCVENVASGRALAGLIGGGAGTQVTEAVTNLRHRLLRRDKSAADAFQTVGRYLGLAIADIANAFDPEVISLAGGIVAASTDAAGVNHVLKGAQDSAAQTCTPRIAATLAIQQSSLENPNLIGVAEYALRSMVS